MYRDECLYENLLFNFLVDQGVAWFNENTNLGYAILISMGIVILGCLHSVLKCICCPKQKPKPTLRRRQSATPQKSRGERHGDALPTNWVDTSKYNGEGVIDIEQLPTPFRGKVIQVSPGKFYRSTSQQSTPRATSPYNIGNNQRMSQIPPNMKASPDNRVNNQRMSMSPDRNKERMSMSPDRNKQRMSMSPDRNKQRISMSPDRKDPGVIIEMTPGGDDYCRG
jgi:hypothetical protein